MLAGTAGAGVRFIQPILADGRKLDDAVGQGWRLFVRDDSVTGTSPRVTRTVAASLDDAGAVTAWLDDHGVDAVLLRPDHCVFGTASGTAIDLIEARARALGLALETA